MNSDSTTASMSESSFLDGALTGQAIRHGNDGAEAHITEDTTPPELVVLDETGNKYRTGVGLSLVGTLLVAIESLENENIRLLFKERTFEMVIA